MVRLIPLALSESMCTLNVADRAERARHRLAAIAERRADDGHDAAIALDGHVAELAQVDDERFEVARRRRS